MSSSPVPPQDPQDADASSLPFREMLAFGCGDFASVLYWQTFMRYLPYYYTDVFGITAGSLATMLLVSRIFDGINDPILGMVADRTESRWGKFRPFILFGCVPFALFGVLTFTTPAFGPSGKLVWAYLTYNALMMLYTTVNIPYTALMGVMTSDPVERTRLASIKFVFAFSAGMVISATLLPMVSALGGDKNPQRGWQLAFVLVGLVAVGFFLVTAFGTKERIKTPPEENTSVLRDLKHLVSNQAWVLLLCTTLTWILFVALRSSVSTHYFKYFIFNGSPETPLPFLGHSFTLEGLVSTFNTLGQAASVAGVVVVGLIAPKFPKKGLFVALFALQIVCTASYYFLEPGELGAIFTLEILGNFLGAPLPVLMWAMYADTADFGEWKSGRRTTALVFSASTMSQKVGWALAAFVAFQLLQLVGFVANEHPSEAVKGSLVRLMSLYPAALGVLSIVVFLFYPLNEARVAEINEDLKRRRAEPG
jgi:GPH family glycoside/pentoside/hexuronide:cation symporter